MFKYLALFILLEFFFAARSQPKTSYWYLRAAFFIGLGFPLSWLADQLWGGWFASHQNQTIFSNLHPIPGGILAFISFQFFQHWWHWAMHKNNRLWRLHQVHHSPERIEALTTYYGHPFDSIVNILIGSSVLWALGLSVKSISMFYVIEVAYDFFTHANIRTPYWVGYFLQRPEAHRLHHEMHSHKYNYSIPLWDMVFGTFRNPRPDEPEVICGFDSMRETRVVDLLLLKDVHADHPQDARAETHSEKLLNQGLTGRKPVSA